MSAPQSANLIVTGWKQENDLVYIKLPAGKYQLGETIFTLPQSGEQVIDLSYTDKLYKILDDIHIVGYKNADTAERINVETFIRRKQELNKSIYDENLEEVVWKKITDRHAFELYIALWQPVREQVSIKQKVEIIVSGHAPIMANPHILPVRKISGDLTNTLYFYSKAEHVNSIIIRYLQQLGYRQVLNLSTSKDPKDREMTFCLHGGLQFAKMYSTTGGVGGGEKYITIEIPGLKQYEKITGRHTGTYSELEAIYHNVDSDVRAIMGTYFNKSKAIDELPKETIGTVLGKINTLAKTIQLIDSMKKTLPEYHSANKQATELIKIFREAASK